MPSVGAIFVPFPPKTGTNLLHPRSARFSHENLVERCKILVQDFAPIKTALNTGILIVGYIVKIVRYTS